MSSDGIGILFVGSVIEELLAPDNRILVMVDGKISGEFKGNFDAASVLAPVTPNNRPHQERVA